MPACITNRYPVVVAPVRPAPPCDDGDLRQLGSQRLKPHHANSVQVFISVSTTVSAPMPLRKMAANPAESVVDRDVQIAGSLTLRCTHNAKNAGRMPTKNTARHPKRGCTKPATSTAAA